MIFCYLKEDEIKYEIIVTTAKHWQTPSIRAMDEPSLLNASKELPPAELALGLRAPETGISGQQWSWEERGWRKNWNSMRVFWSCLNHPIQRTNSAWDFKVLPPKKANRRRPDDYWQAVFCARKSHKVPMYECHSGYSWNQWFVAGFYLPVDLYCRNRSFYVF